MGSDKKNTRRGLKLPKVVAREAAQKVLEAHDQNTFIGLRNRVILEVFYRAGLRNSELTNLGETDVNIKDGYIYVQQGKESKDRMIPIDAGTIEWLLKWIAIRPSSEYFFTTRAGGMISDRYIRKMVADSSRKAGVFINDNHVKKPIHPHTLRHCFATELLEDDFNVREVQALLGHENLNTTMIYLSVRPEALAKKIRERKRSI